MDSPSLDSAPLQSAGLVEACKSLAIFPLPGAVLMPNAPMPLHVFEPRYRKLVADCLAGGLPLAIPQIRKNQEEASRPALLPFTSVGVISGHKLLDDGRYHILINPLARIRLRGEIFSDTPYRIFETEVLTDIHVAPDVLERSGERVRGLLLMLLGRAGKGDAALARSVAQAPASRLAEMIAPLVITAEEERQRYLSEDNPLRRATFVEDAAAGLFAENVVAAEA